MNLAEQMIEAVENKIGIIIPRSGWDPEVDAVLDKIRNMEAANKEMQEDVDFLACLNAAGVDNWSGCEQAQEMYDEEYAS